MSRALFNPPIRIQMEQCDPAPSDKALIAELSRAILRYGQHQAQCLSRHGLPRCTCGFRALVSEIQRRREQ